MNDHETIVDFQSDGSEHLFVYEVIVGGPRYRTEFGETSVAVQSAPASMFTLLSAGSDFPLTDAGWEAFFAKQSAALERLDTERRKAANRHHEDFWNQRHAFARAERAVAPAVADPSATLDRLILERIEASKRRLQPAADDADLRFYRDQVQPLLAEHCHRCHGEKQQGELSLLTREALLRGGESGSPAVTPGELEASYLWELVSADPDDYRMPPQGEGLQAEERATIRQWIERGAPMADQAGATTEIPPQVADLTFLRRVYLDTLGVAPSLEAIDAFLADDPAARRQRVIDRLLQDERLADHWVGYWQDVFAENPNLLKPKLNNTGPFRWWIHEAMRDNKPLDRFATELMLMRGATWDGGTAGFAIASENDVPMAAKAHVIGSAFLGVQMKCARCHDAPYHQWKQADLFQMAAMLGRKPLTLPPSSTVPAAFFEKQERKPLIAVTTEPGSTLAPEWPFAEMAGPAPEGMLLNPQDSRERLAARVTLSRRFAEVMANRIWQRLMGRGIVEPVDDWEGNAPSDPALLQHLADTLIHCDYDLRAFCGVIMNSDAYQREAINPPTGGPPEQRRFAGPYRRRMTAEQIVDTAFHAVGQTMETEPLTMDVEGTLPAQNFLHFGHPRRAWEFTTLANERDRPSLALPRTQAIVDVLKAFGWRNSRPEPSSHREHTPNLIQPGVLANGVMGTWLTRLSDESELTALVLQEQPVEKLVDRLFLALLTREPSEAEQARFVAMLQPGYAQRHVPAEAVEPAPDAPRFRYVSWSNHLNSEANKIKVEMEAVARRGDPPTRFLESSWRRRAEDAVWALLNSPEMILVP
jgi:mono/diheme cytochrome c family protein